jgi:FKBP-type peptidyl-prolyl cis-trans isomerase (trigger factor)
MFNPLVDSFNQLTDSEIENKISELGRKYFQSYNPQVQQQISVLLEMYKEEARARRAKQYLKAQQQTGDNGLDSLINIS